MTLRPPPPPPPPPRAANLDCFVRRHSGLTQIHGDCKAWNVFLSRSTCQEGPEEEEEEQQMLFIDMQWTGKGHPLQVGSDWTLGHGRGQRKLRLPT